MELVLKKEYRNTTLSNGKFKKFNTNDIPKGLYQYYFDNGFEFIFDIVEND
jgi:hypothetical protein